MTAPEIDALAHRYAAGMTSIRGRRVVRFVCREFAGYEMVRIVEVEGRAAVVGTGSDGSVALVQSDGRGPTIGLVRWHGEPERATVTRFDLLKDSLPAVGADEEPRAGLREAVRAAWAEQR